MSWLKSDPVVVPRTQTVSSWRMIRAGSSIPTGHHVIYAVGDVAYLTDGSEMSMMNAVGVTDGSFVALGETIRYMPVNGIIAGSLLNGQGDLWAAEDGTLVSCASVSSNQHTRRVGTLIPPSDIAVDFGIITFKKD